MNGLTYIDMASGISKNLLTLSTLEDARSQDSRLHGVVAFIFPNCTDCRTVVKRILQAVICNVQRRTVFTALIMSSILAISACGKTLSDEQSGLEGEESKSANTVILSGLLSSDQIVSATEPVSSNNGGTAIVELDLVENRLYGEVELDSTAVIAVQLRKGSAGRNGNLRIDLEPHMSNPRLWVIPSGQTVDAGEAQTLVKGKYYIEVKTLEFPGGELRTQLLRDSQELIISRLSPQQVTDGSVDSESSAKQYLTIDFNDGDVNSVIRFSDGFTPTEVVLGLGIAGTEKQKLFDYAEDTGANGVWELAGEALLDSELLNALSSGAIFAKANTQEYPQGELRGQILPSHLELRISELSGDGVLPETDSDASARVFLTINNFSGKLQGSLKYKGMDPTAAVLLRITNSQNPGNAMILYDWIKSPDIFLLPADSVLTSGDFNSLDQGWLYVFVMSEAFPSGEIGGRI